MHKLQELVKEAKTAIEKVSGELFAMTTSGGPATYERDPLLVVAEVKNLRKVCALLRTVATQRTTERDRAQASADRLRQTRNKVREVLHAEPHEETVEAAKRVMNTPCSFAELEIRHILKAKPTEATTAAAKRAMKPDGKMTRALENLRAARAEVREILGARPGEGSRAAAKRVVAQLEAQPIFPKTNCDRSTVFHVYNELDAAAQRAGYPPGSVGTYVRRLAVGKKTYAE